jgi:hypothetical protein
MRLYNYDKETGKYLFSSEALVRNGVEIIPAFSTKERPLKSKEGFEVVYKNNEWGYEEIKRSVDPKYREKREAEYNKVIPVGDQLDAILKAFEIVLQDDAELPLELIDIIDKWQSIKEAYPKA